MYIINIIVEIFKAVAASRRRRCVWRVTNRFGFLPPAQSGFILLIVGHRSPTNQVRYVNRDARARDYGRLVFGKSERERAGYGNRGDHSTRPRIVVQKENAGLVDARWFPASSLPAHFRGLPCGSLRRRTPGPPPFSSMISTPAASLTQREGKPLAQFAAATLDPQFLSRNEPAG